MVPPGYQEPNAAADDLIILVKSQRAGERLMRSSLSRYLQTTLELTVNPARSKVAPMSECGFLGFTIRRTKIRRIEQALA